MTDYNIRKYKDSDFDTIVDLMAKLQEYFVGLDLSKEIKPLNNDDAKTYVRQAIKDVKHKNGIVFVAELNHVIVGFVQGVVVKHERDTFYRLTHFKNKAEGWIGLLFIEPGVRGVGIGKRLIDAMKAYFKNQGCHTMRLKVSSNNKLALSVYKKYGFVSKDIEMAVKI